jgi:hypothetical protein
MMDISEREDIIESIELEKKFNLDLISFENIMRLLTSFILDVLISEEHLQKLAVESSLKDIIIIYTNNAKLFQDGLISAEELESQRVSAWKTYDSLNSSAKQLMRIVVCCLYDRSSAEFDTYGSRPIVETIFSSLADLGSGYARLFRVYAERSLE